jgi:hypothetical protein
MYLMHSISNVDWPPRIVVGLKLPHLGVVAFYAEDALMTT